VEVVTGANTTSLSKQIVLPTAIHGFEKGSILFRFGLGNVAASPWTVRSLKDRTETSVTNYQTKLRDIPDINLEVPDNVENFSAVSRRNAPRELAAPAFGYPLPCR